jgi:hypothetical protein
VRNFTFLIPHDKLPAFMTRLRIGHSGHSLSGDQQETLPLQRHSLKASD